MIDVTQVVAMHVSTVKEWHDRPTKFDDPETFQGYDYGVLAIAIRQHRYNFDLWHEEDIARSPDVTDTRIAEVKRAIDRLNQKRNDWIEKLDDWLTDYMQVEGIEPKSDAKLNTETPGSVIDRLSIIAIRIYHLHEQLERTDVEASHLERVQQRIAICNQQQADLAQSLRELLSDFQSGAKRHRTYRQFKMYNDPTMNPYLYSHKATTR